ncbi:ABC transporter ATP-binding protein [Paracoccus alkanivorans]|nr:ABC transporter ATP-binding protein [Paracoccus alkanivorans]
MALPGLLSNGRRRGLLTVSALTLAQGAAAGAAAFATRGLFEALHGAAPLPAALLVTLAASGLVIAVTRVSARVTGEWLGQSYARDIRLALFEHTAGMAASDVARRRNGYMSLRFVGDMTAFRNWIGLGLPRLVAGAILIPLTLAVLWSLAPVFAWLTLPLVILALVSIGLGGLRLQPLHRRLRARRARIAVDMAERMPLAPELDRLGRRRIEMGQLDHRIGRMVRAAVARLRLAEALKAIPDAIAGLAAMLIILGGFRTGASPGVIAGGLAAFGLLISPMRDLATVWNLHSAWRSAAIKADAALSRQQREAYTDRCSLPKGAAAIAISDLALPSGGRLNLELAAASVVGTELNERDSTFLFSVLNGLEKVPEDAVTLSGICLRRLSRGSLRRSVVTIGARPPILLGSFRRALTLGVSQRMDDADLEALARESGLTDALSRLGGLDGKLSEGGRNLLFSERALVSLVRAKQLKPRLILVESQIAALEVEARNRIMDWTARSGATVLFQRGVMPGLSQAA